MRIKLDHKLVNLETGMTLPVYLPAPLEGNWVYATMPALAPDESENDCVLEHYDVDEHKENNDVVTVRKYRFVVDAQKKAARHAMETQLFTAKEKVKLKNLKTPKLEDLADFCEQVRIVLGLEP